MPSSTKTGVLLINLGSPAAPTPKAIRAYLAQFLSDPMVMDMPWLIRQLILRMFILPKRPQKIAPRYQSIWTDEGAPLIRHTSHLAQRLDAELGESFLIDWAMRYGEPSLEKSLKRFNEANLKELIIIPLFPQYASATTGSVIKEVHRICSGWSSLPSFTFVSAFFNHPGFLDAFTNRAKPLLERGFDHLLFSFHGLPSSQIIKSDSSGKCLQKEGCCAEPDAPARGCYRAQCLATAKALAQRLELKEDCWSFAFQSRLGRALWLEPYLAEQVEALAKKGVKRLLVISPSFVADCLETTDELGVEMAERFLRLGGEAFALVPFLNDGADWVTALADLVKGV